MTLTQSPNTSGLECTLIRSPNSRKVQDVIQIEDASGEELEISFRRTVRVPDGDGESDLPPSMGKFPLYSVASYEDKLPAPMALKGGVFLPMYREFGLSWPKTPIPAYQLTTYRA